MKDQNEQSWPIIPQYLWSKDFFTEDHKSILNEFELIGLHKKYLNSQTALVQLRQDEIEHFNLIQQFTEENYKSLKIKFEEKKVINNVMFLDFWISTIVIDECTLALFISSRQQELAKLNQFRDYVKFKFIQIKELFIRRKNDTFIKSIRQSLIEISQIDYKHGFQRYWRKIEKTLEKLVATYPARHVAVFATNSAFTIDNKMLALVSSYGINKHTYKFYSYDKSNLELNYSGVMETSLENSTLLNHLYYKGEIKVLSKDEDLIRILPTPFSINSMIVIWVRYNNGKWARLLKRVPNSNESKVFHSLIRSFYTVLASTYTSLVSSHLIDIIKDSWRILGHESGQISAAIDQLRVANIDNLNIKSMRNKAVLDVGKNLKGLVEQYNYIISNTNPIIVGSLNTWKEEFYIFGEFFFKWQSIYKMACEEKSIKIVVPEEYKIQTKPKIYANKILLEQVLYNLFNNAVKYGYEGTKIHVNYNYKRQEDLPSIITITNYSSEINNTEIIWELFGRDKNNPEEGLGVGLYLSKEIVKEFGGQIKLEQRHISKFNLPILKTIITSYDDIPKGYIDQYNTPSKDELLEAFQLIENTDEYKKCVHLSRKNPVYRPLKKSMAYFINKETTEITFKIMLP